jgi:2,3-bisphosphoglycerate-independent phosphoglycerate mutase
MMVLRYKLLFIVLDGAADSLSDPVTSLEVAEKPGLDYIAENGVCGAMYVISRGVAPESDEAVISLFGYDPHEVYTGRGPIEAVGIGMRLEEGREIAFRANFATIDPVSMRIIDRRVGRSLSREEARALAESLDNMDLGLYRGYAKVRASIGHRAVVIIGSSERILSPMVSNNDPAYERRGLVSVASQSFDPYLREIKPLEDTEEARATAELANIFVRKAIEILKAHHINRSRVEKGLPPANAILLRDAGGRIPRPQPLSERYKCRFAVLAEMPVEIGLGRIFGAETIEMEFIEDPVENYRDRLDKTIKALKENDIVYIHLKGPDEPGHDGNHDLKKKRIEEIDRYFIRPLLEKISGEVAILVTADHATPPSKKAHTDDPVPIAFYAPNIKSDDVKRFTERECLRGVLGVYEHGWKMFPDIYSRYLVVK